MATVLITGAGRGIGLALVQQYHARGDRVIATVRAHDPSSPLQRLDGDIEVLTLSPRLKRPPRALSDGRLIS
jgi:NAD(P)-dependent dehydrogenase (short-subunit alcohol dehydrogenase family)